MKEPYKRLQWHTIDCIRQLKYLDKNIENRDFDSDKESTVAQVNRSKTDSHMSGFFSHYIESDNSPSLYSNWSKLITLDTTRITVSRIVCNRVSKEIRPIIKYLFIVSQVSWSQHKPMLAVTISVCTVFIIGKISMSL